MTTAITRPASKCSKRSRATLSDDIWIVAPAEEQSGAGHSLTLTRPLRVRRFGEQRFAVSGTPTDAVMMALAEIMKDRPPDLILSGVNRGANLGRGRDLFGHRLRGDGGRARRRPLDRAEPGLCPRRHGRHRAVRRRGGLGRARAAAAARRAARAAHADQRQLSRRCRPMRSRACASSARACAITAGCRSSPTAIRAAMTITGSGSGRRSRPRPHATDLEAIARRLCRGHAAASRPDASRIARYARRRYR